MDTFFDELPDGGASIEAVSMDMGPAYAKAVRQRAPAAVICFDPFHVIKTESTHQHTSWSELACQHL